MQMSISCVPTAIAAAAMLRCTRGFSRNEIRNQQRCVIVCTAKSWLELFSELMSNVTARRVAAEFAMRQIE
jgi:hypothetical protein